MLGDLVDWSARIIVIIANHRVISGGKSLSNTAILEHLIPSLYVVYLIHPSSLLLFYDLLWLLIKMIVVFKFTWGLAPHIIQIRKWCLWEIARGPTLSHLLDRARWDHSLLLVIEVPTQWTIYSCRCWRALPGKCHTFSCQMDCLGLDVVQLVRKESSVFKVVQLALNNISLSAYQLQSWYTHPLIVDLWWKVRQTRHFKCANHFIWLRWTRKACLVHLYRWKQVIQIAPLRYIAPTISYLPPRTIISCGCRLNTYKWHAFPVWLIRLHECNVYARELKKCETQVLKGSVLTRETLHFVLEVLYVDIGFVYPLDDICILLLEPSL